MAAVMGPVVLVFVVDEEEDANEVGLVVPLIARLDGDEGIPIVLGLRLVCVDADRLAWTGSAVVDLRSPASVGLTLPEAFTRLLGVVIVVVGVLWR